MQHARPNEARRYRSAIYRPTPRRSRYRRTQCVLINNSCETHFISRVYIANFAAEWRPIPRHPIPAVRVLSISRWNNAREGNRKKERKKAANRHDRVFGAIKHYRSVHGIYANASNGDFSSIFPREFLRCLRIVRARLILFRGNFSRFSPAK